MYLSQSSKMSVCFLNKTLVICQNYYMLILKNDNAVNLSGS